MWNRKGGIYNEIKSYTSEIIYDREPTRRR